MDILKEVTLVHFNEELKSGTPVKVIYFPNTPRKQIDYGFVTKNLKDKLVYQTYKDNITRQFELEVGRIGKGVEIEVGRWVFGE